MLGKGINVLKFLGFCAITAVLIYLLQMHCMGLVNKAYVTGYNNAVNECRQSGYIQPSGETRTKYLGEQTHISYK